MYFKEKLIEMHSIWYVIHAFKNRKEIDEILVVKIRSAHVEIYPGEFTLENSNGDVPVKTNFMNLSWNKVLET